MKTIDNDIKTGQFKQIYLLYGEEQYLIRQYRDKLKHALAADDDTMNLPITCLSFRKPLILSLRKKK